MYSMGPQRTCGLNPTNTGSIAAKPPGPVPLELSNRRAHCPCMADPRDTDPDDRDPRERELERRSDGPAVSPWLVIGSILLLGVAVYVFSAVVL